MVSRQITKILKLSQFPLNDVDFVLYHKKCPDGFGSAFVSWLTLGNRAKYIARYPDDFSFPPQLKNKNVLIVDINFPKNIIDKLRMYTKNLLIIDHHHTYYDEHIGQDYIIQDKRYSAIYLTWKTFFPKQPVPKLIKYIQDHDIMSHKFKNTEPFMLAFDVYYERINPNNFPSWKKLFNDKEIDRLVYEGYFMSQYKQKLLSKNKHIVYERKWGKYKIGMANYGMVGLTSDMGNYLSENKPYLDFILLWSFHYKDKENRVVLRTRKKGIDVSEVAKKFGGGGHPGAASFVWKGHMQKLFHRNP